MFSIQREEVRAFPHLTAVYGISARLAIPFAAGEGMQVFPFAEVMRAVEQYATALVTNSGSDAHVPEATVLPKAGVAKAGDGKARRRRGQNRLRQLFPGTQVRI